MSDVRGPLATAVFGACVALGLVALAINGPLWFRQQFQEESPCDVSEDARGLVVRKSTNLECIQSGMAGATVLAIDGQDLASLAVHDRMALARGPAGSRHEWRIESEEVESTRDVVYRADTLTRALTAAGNKRAELVMLGIRLFAAACQVGLQLYAAWLLFLVGRSYPLARAFAGGVVLETVVLALMPSHPSVLGQWAFTASAMVCVAMLATASVVLPRGRASSWVATGLAVTWMVVGGVLLWPGLGKALGLPSGVRALAQNAVALLVILWMARERRGLKGGAARRAFSWVVGGYLVQNIALALMAMPLPEIVLDLHGVVGLRAASVMLPFGLVLGTRLGTHVEVMDGLRRAAIALTSAMTVSGVAFVVALVVPRIGEAFGFDVSTIGPPLAEPVIVMLPGILLAVTQHARIVMFVDTAFFPSRVHADEVVQETVDALSDAYRVEDVSWCLDRFARAAFDARATLVAWHPQRGLADVPPEELASLGRGEFVERPPPNDYAPSVWLVPLRMGAELLGVMTVTCRDELGLSPHQQVLVQTVADAAGAALWRATRPLLAAQVP